MTTGMADDEQQSVKRAREEHAFEVQCLQNSYASKEKYMRRTIASLEDTLHAASEEAAGLRAELWRARAALDDAQARLAVEGGAADFGEEEAEEEEDLVHAAVEHMKGQVKICEDAHPKRRYYYPSSPPAGLQDLSQRGLERAICEVKAWVKRRALAKRGAKAKEAGDDANEDSA